MKRYIKHLLLLFTLFVFLGPVQTFAACDASTVTTCRGCPNPGYVCLHQPLAGSTDAYNCFPYIGCNAPPLVCQKSTRGRCDVCPSGQQCVKKGILGLYSECQTVVGQCGAQPPFACNQWNYLRCDVCGGTQQCLRNGSSYVCGAPTTACVTPVPTSPPGTTPTVQPSPTPFSPYKPPTNDTFDMVNPLKIGGGTDLTQDQPSAFANDLDSPGGIVSRVLLYAFPLAGLILFAMLTWGGFEMIMGAANKKSMDAGKQRVTAAIVGFLILFVSYWIWQVLEIVFGISVL